MSVAYLLIVIKSLAPLFKLLSGDSQLNAIRQITPEANREISLLNNAAAKTVAHIINPSLPYQLLILNPSFSAFGITYQ